MRKTIIVLSVILFCGMSSVSWAAPPNQLTNQAMESLQKNQAAGTTTNPPKVKPGTNPAGKKTAKTVKPNGALAVKPQVLVKTYQTDLKTQKKDTAQYQKDVNTASALLGQIKNGKPTAAQAQELSKLKSQILVEQTQYKTDNQAVSKDVLKMKSAAAALKADAGKNPPAAKQTSKDQNLKNSSQTSKDTQTLLQQVANADAQGKNQTVSGSGSQGQSVNVGDQFQMQMLMNNFSRASEMSSTENNAMNGAVKNMAQTVSR